MAGQRILFGLDDGSRLAACLAACTGLPLAPLEVRTFEDGEHKIRPLVPVRGVEVLVVAGLGNGVGLEAASSGEGAPHLSVNDRLVRLLFFVATLRDAGAAGVTVVAPTLCYTRKDRRTWPDDPVTTRYAAALFEAMGTTGLVTLEVHNPAAFENAFRLPVRHVPGAEILAPHFAGLAAREPVVVASPDFGGAKRVEDFRRRLEVAAGRPVGHALVEKHRRGGMVTGTLLAGDVAGATVIIHDDLMSTGGTLCRAAARLREAGARQVIAAVTHALLAPGSSTALADPAIDAFVFTDSALDPASLPTALAARITILPCAPALAAFLGVD